MMEKNGERLGSGTKIAFGMGDIFGGGSMMIMGIYYLYFLTDVIRISPALAGLVLLLGKIWDAVNDPLMGIITDRTSTRFGRRRPYLLAGIVFIFLSTVMIWYPAGFRSETARFVFVLFAYIFFDAIVTMVMVPYNALASELTLNYNERTSLTSLRMFFSMFSSLVCAVVPMEMLKLVPDVHTGHIMMGAGLGLFFCLPYLATFFFTKEREEFHERRSHMGFLESYREAFRIRSFVHVLCMYLFSFLTMDVVMSVVIYFMTYYLGLGSHTNYVMGALLLTQIAVIPLYYQLARRTSKKTGFITATAIWIAIMLFSFAIVPGVRPWIMYLYGCGVGLATGGIVVMIYSIFPDLPDVDELNTGFRREGIYAGLVTFARKLSAAVAQFLISQTMFLVGYNKPLTETIGGVTKLVNQPQSENFLLALRIIFAIVPVLLLLCCLYFATRYPLNPELHGRLKVFLEKKRRGAEVEGELAAEEAELRRLLV